jgi:hypothetical protein
MDPAIVVAVIGVAGSAVVALLNHHLQQRVQTQEAKIAELFALSMSDDLFAHLDRMASNSYGPYWVDPEMRYGLGPELNYLKILGYVEFGVDSSVPDIREMPKGDNPQLSAFVRVTKQGEAFIELRKQALRVRRLRG